MNKQQELMSLFKEYIAKTSDTLYRDIYIENSVITDIIKSDEYVILRIIP